MSTALENLISHLSQVNERVSPEMKQAYTEVLTMHDTFKRALDKAEKSSDPESIAKVIQMTLDVVAGQLSQEKTRRYDKVVRDLGKISKSINVN